MGKRVSTDTITEITSNGGFSPPSKTPPAPSADQLIKQIREDLHIEVEWTRRNLARATDPYAQQREGERLQRCLHKQERFETLLKTKPDGFELCPVFYARVDRDKNQEVMKEYTEKVRAHFLQYLASYFEDDLKALGLCDIGIDRMHQGLDPANKEGRFYQLNVDHIIERSGGGLWADTKEHDPDTPGFPPRFPLNHMGNFILLPEQIHAYKNELNNVQRLTELAPGQGKWALMMIPKRSDQQPGFVAAAQKKGHPLAGLLFRDENFGTDMNQARFTLEQAFYHMKPLLENDDVANIVKRFDKIADKKDMSVAHAANDDEQTATPGKKTMRQQFNEVVARHPKVEEQTEAFVRPAIVEATRRISALFDRASRRMHNSKGQEEFRKFVRLYHSRRVDQARHAIVGLPLAESATLAKAFWEIDGKIKKIEAQLAASPHHPKPSYVPKNASPPRKTSAKPKTGSSPSRKSTGKPKTGSSPSRKNKGKSKKRSGQGKKRQGPKHN